MGIHWVQRLKKGLVNKRKLNKIHSKLLDYQAM
jgi:hypothetical protein